MKVLDLNAGRRHVSTELSPPVPRMVTLSPRTQKPTPELQLRPIATFAVSGPVAGPSKVVLRAVGGGALVLVLVGGGFAYTAYQKNQARTAILAVGAEPSANGLLSAIADGDLQLLPAYERLGFSIGNTPRAIEAAIASGSPDVLRQVLAAGAGKANEPNLDSLMLKAVEKDQADMLKQLAAAGLDVNAQPPGRPSLLQTASAGKKWAAAQSLLELGAKIDAVDNKGNTVAHALVASNQPPLLDLFKSKGGDLLRPNTAGVTPLLLAAATSADQVTAYLTKSGADPLAKTGTLPSALELAMSRKDDLIMKAIASEHVPSAAFLTTDGGRQLLSDRMVQTSAALIGQGINPVGVFPDGVTTLGMAVDTGDAPLVDRVIEKGAKANDTMTINGVSGVTPLMLAAMGGHKDVVAVLIKAGAKVDSEASNGLNARDAALRSGRHDIAQLMAQAQP